MHIIIQYHHLSIKTPTPNARLKKSSYHTTLTTMCYTAAIASHKFVVSFCVCLELQQSGTRRGMFFTYLAVFSLMSPLGSAIGTLISGQSQ